MKTISKFFVGVDVSKKTLDININPIDKSYSFENSHAGIELMKQMLIQYSIKQIVCESSGGYEALMLKCLKQAGHNIWRVQAKRIKKFIESEGIHVKTDHTDARLIALFASQKQTKQETFIRDDNQEVLRSLQHRRQVIVKMIKQESVRLQHPQVVEDATISIQNILECLKKELTIIEEKLKLKISTMPNLKRHMELLQTMPGIGIQTARILAIEVPELGHTDSGKIAAIVGVAPYTKQSGSYNGKSFIKNGRSLPSQILYMASLAAIRGNNLLSDFYKKLTAKGKKAKVALVAVIRKMLVILNAMVKSQKPWEPLVIC